jgi:hypothetical protein
MIVSSTEDTERNPDGDPTDKPRLFFPLVSVSSVLPLLCTPCHLNL